MLKCKPVLEPPFQLKDVTILFSPMIVFEFHMICALDHVINSANTLNVILYAHVSQHLIFSHDISILQMRLLRSLK